MTIDIRFRHQLKGHFVFVSGEGLDIAVRLWLLSPKLVAWKSNDFQPVVIIMLLQLLELSIMPTGLASCTCHVCNVDNFIFEFAKVQSVPVNVYP